MQTAISVSMAGPPGWPAPAVSAPAIPVTTHRVQRPSFSAGRATARVTGDVQGDFAMSEKPKPQPKPEPTERESARAALQASMDRRY